MKRVAFAAMTALCAASAQFVSLGHAAEVKPDRLVRETTEKIGVLLKGNLGIAANDPASLYALMDFCEDVLPHIDFRAMSKAVLATHWREANGNQRARFNRAFRNQLVRVYAEMLRKQGKEEGEVIYLPFQVKPGDKTAVVRTELKRSDGRPNVPVNYHFHKADSIWKVYDISIEGVSLILTYRGTYAEFLQHGELDALIADIVKRNRKPPGDD